MNVLVGPPVGAFLFAAGTAWPFLVQVLCAALAVLLVARIATPKGPVRDPSDTRVRRDIVDGLRWIRAHPPVRTLGLVILVFNVTWGAAWSVLVLYSLDHLHMSAVGFGFLTPRWRRWAGRQGAVDFFGIDPKYLGSTVSGSEEASITVYVTTQQLQHR